MPFFVYILECADGTYYVGHTASTRNRFLAHALGIAAVHTRTRGAARLVHREPFATRLDAIRRERQLKGWTRAKKAALIAGNLARLKSLARSRQSRSVAR